jgi:hypothetical protein
VRTQVETNSDEIMAQLMEMYQRWKSIPSKRAAAQ